MKVELSEEEIAVIIAALLYFQRESPFTGDVDIASICRKLTPPPPPPPPARPDWYL